MTATRAAAGRGPKPLAQWKERIADLAHAALAPVARALSAAGVEPDHLTWAGAALSVMAGLAFFDGHSRLAALLLAFAGLCDILDGELARRSGVVSTFGAFLDSTLDRLSEALAFAGIAGFCLRNLVALVVEPSRAAREAAIGLEPITWAVLAFIAILALVGSFLVSYTRARAEGLGLECKVGWFERPERLVLLIVAGLLRVFWAMSAALLLLAVLSFVTAAQRVAHVWRSTRGARRDA